jgi:hypothetical protein
MSYTLEWVRDRRLLKVRHFGDVTTDEIQDRLSEVGREIGSGDRPYLLVDVREATTYPSVADLYFLAEATVYRPRVSAKTAFIFSERTAKSIEFVVLVASNRGCSVQAFTEEEAAIRWLFSSSRTTKSPGRITAWALSRVSVVSTG